MLKFIINNLPNLGLCITIIIILWIIQKYLLKYIFKKYIKYLDKNNKKLESQIFKCFEAQVRYSIFTFSTFVALIFLTKFNLFYNTIALNFLKSIGFIYFFSGLINICSSLEKDSFELKKHYSINLENIMFSFFSKVVKVLLFFTLISLISYQWGYNITGLITGLGIGGLAIALGAKDLLSNIFGGIAIVFDKPFSIGDWISIENNIEGHVEDINFRSTRIRTFDKSVIYIPNALLANQPIYNWTRRKVRRIRFIIGLPTTTTPDKVIIIIDKIRLYISNHEKIEKDDIYIAFDQITQQSIDLLIQYYTNTVDYAEALKIKQDVNFEILSILKDENF